MIHIKCLEQSWAYNKPPISVSSDDFAMNIIVLTFFENQGSKFT